MTQFIFPPQKAKVLDQEVMVQVTEEKPVEVVDGDEVHCLVVGTAKVLGGGTEVEVTDPRFVRVVEVRRVE